MNVEAPAVGVHPRSGSLRADRAGLVAAVLVAVTLGGAGMVRHANWWSGAIDLGVFDQGIWLLSRGFAPEVTINGRNLFADHLSPVVLAFVPLYRVAATPYWLFAAQGAALGATLLPLRALARHEGAPRWVATLAIVLGTPLTAAAMFEFHPATLATPFIAWTILECRRDEATRATVAGALVLCCRAELAWVLLGIAIVAGPACRRRLVALSAVGVVAGYAVPAALGARGTFAVHYGHLGATPGEAVTHPWRMLEALASADTVTKLVILLLPVAGLALVKPRWAAATVVAALPLLLSRWAGTVLPWFHYWAPVYPIAVGGALAALGDPERHRFVDPRLVLVGGALAVSVMSPLSPRAPDSVGLRALTDPQEDRAAAAAQVDDEEPVAASNRILSHLTHRREAWLFPGPYATDEPAELSAEPSPAAARRVRLALLDGDDVERAASLGLSPARRFGDVVTFTR